MSREIRILLVGDAVGRPGREAVASLVPKFRASGRAHFVIVNGENSAHGKGITRETARMLLATGCDVITAGNHTWDNKDIFNIIRDETRLLRPANCSADPTVPGRGWGIFPVVDMPDVQVGVFNLLGRVHMAHVENPFVQANEIIETIRKETPIAVLDFHAEATSEKISMGWHLDGRATSVTGTHTHVQTADNRVLPAGTAYMTDIGMTGGHEGVIGVKHEAVLHRFLTGLPVKHEVAEGDVWLCGALITVDAESGRALNIERVREQPE